MELAAQIAGVVAKMGQFMQDLSITVAVKGSMVTKNVELQNQIVIGTPGTVLDWCTRYRVIDLRKIRAFVFVRRYDESAWSWRVLHQNYQVSIFTVVWL